MVRYAVQIARTFRLRGSNGVDFILSENGLKVLEINPRFQGSLDTVELSTGINIFDAHVKSFSGELPASGEASCFAARAIVFASSTTLISKELSERLVNCMHEGRAADIPRPGWVVHPDEPVTTLLETSRMRKDVIENICKRARYIKAMTEN
jgi:predicted ATP-grasp superfamily ATP-dependent carboligase